MTAVAAPAASAGTASFILTTMQIGLIGAGNMAVALARGWGEPVLVYDLFRPRAEALVAELGGEVAESAAELAAARRRRRAVPQARGARARRDRRSAARPRASSRSSAASRCRALKAAYGGTPVVRMLPSVPVEVRQGVSVHARDADADAALEARALELFGRVGPVVTLDEGQIDVAMGLMSCAPAYVALVAEAQVDAGVRAGLPADVAGELVGANFAGTAALLQARGMDTLARPPLGHLARRLDRARPRRARARRRARGVRRRDAGGAGAMSDVLIVAVGARADRGLPQRAAVGLHPHHLRLHHHAADLLVRRARPVLALVERGARLPARRLRAVPRASSGASSRRSARSTSARSSRSSSCRSSGADHRPPHPRVSSGRGSVARARPSCSPRCWPPTRSTRRS